MLLKLGVIAAAALLVFGQAQAAVITGTAVIAESSEFTSLSRFAGNVVNGAGFQASPPGAFSIQPNFTMWLTAPGDAAPSITFSLGATYNLSSARIWNYNENNGTPTVELARGVNTGDVQTSTDNVTFTTIANITLSEAPGVNNVDFSQVVGLSGTAAYIRFTNLVSFAPGGNNFTGLSQVQFSGSSINAETAIPEPFSAPLLVVGLVATWMLRRREVF